MVKTKVPVVSRDKGLANYLQEVRKYPILEPEEEYMLAERWKNHADTEAARVLITSHLRLVAKIALGFRGYGLPLEDVISEGNVGLMKAVKRFEPERGFRLSTYAMWWIRASIQEYILRSWSLVKIGTTSAQKKLFFNLRKIKSQLQAFEEGDLAPEVVAEIATRLQVPEADVVIVNPSHYAVALKWARTAGGAPVCVAKGVDEIALRIKEIAYEEGVAVYSDPPTARALFAHVRLDAQILPEHYAAVAVAIRYADALSRKARSWR